MINYNEESIFFAAANNSCTALIEYLKFSFSSSLSSISITFSTPFFPIMTGTPAYKSLKPYSPFKYAAQGNFIF